MLCLGSINADFQVRVARRPEISESLVAHAFARLGGGKAANVAFLCARLGLAARLFGHVGDDDLAEQALAPLREAGVDVSGVRRVAGRPTGVAMITVPPDGAKGIVLALNANDEPWSPEDHAGLDAALAGAPPRSVLVADCEMDGGALERALRKARPAGLRVVLDPSPAAQVGDALLPLCDFIVPNAGEAETLTGIACNDAAAAAHAAQLLRRRGALAACVKLSDGGCVYADAAQQLHLLPPPVEVVDTTGAGDAFAGALAAALARRRAPLEAVRLAVAASRLAVAGYGSQPSYPGAAELEAGVGQVTVREVGDAG